VFDIPASYSGVPGSVLALRPAILAEIFHCFSQFFKADMRIVSKNRLQSLLHPSHFIFHNQPPILCYVAEKMLLNKLTKESNAFRVVIQLKGSSIAGITYLGDKMLLTN
jgi:hypothetical protein